MKTLDDVLNEWAKDSVIDELNIQQELLKIPQLKSKYMRVYSNSSMKVKSLETEYNRVKRIKWQYYSGDLNHSVEELAEYGFDQPWPKKTLKTEIPIYLDGDKDLTDILARKIVAQEIVDACEEIMKELNNRTYQIRAYIDYKKFLEGF